MARANPRDNSLAVGIAILIVAILWFIAWLQLQVIYFSRMMFWITLFLIPIGLIGGIVFLIFGIREDDSSYFYNSNRDIYFVIVGICVIFFIFSLFTINNFYRGGYSDEALQREAELKKAMVAYQTIIDLLTLQDFEKATNQAIEETIDNLCQDPNYPCGQMRSNYQVYKDIKGWKDTADNIAKFTGMIKNA